MARRGATWRGVALAASVAAGVAAACVRAAVPDSLEGPPPSTTPTTAAPTPEPDCGDLAASLRPTGPATTAVPAGSTMAEIRQRGLLRVGVDTATLQMSSVDPLTGEFEGFDVDIAKEVSRALFGDPDRIAFVGIPSSDRVQALVDGEVDIVVDVFTPTCGRRQEVDFSTNYLDSAQRVLVREDDPARTTAELADHEICGTAGSTTLARVAEVEGVTPVPAAERADCLVMLQEGEVDGMSTNDTILVGFRAQDPNLRFLDGSLFVEPTAVGVPLGQDDMVRYVNAVLEQVRSSGRWDELYAQWLEPLLLVDAQPPPPRYVD